MPFSLHNPKDFGCSVSPQCSCAAASAAFENEKEQCEKMPEGTHHLFQDQSKGRGSNTQLEDVFFLSLFLQRRVTTSVN